MFRIHLFRDLQKGSAFYVYGAVDGSPALVVEEVLAINPNLGEGLTLDYELDKATGMVMCYKYDTDKALVRLKGGQHIVIFIPMDSPVLTMPGLYDHNAVNKIANQLSPSRVSNNLENLPMKARKIPYEGIEANLASPSRLKTGASFWAESVPLKVGDLLTGPDGCTVHITEVGPLLGTLAARAALGDENHSPVPEGMTTRGFDSTANARLEAAEPTQRRIIVEEGKSPPSMPSPTEGFTFKKVHKVYSFSDILEALMAQPSHEVCVRNCNWPTNTYMCLAADRKSFDFFACDTKANSRKVQVHGWQPSTADLFDDWEKCITAGDLK